MDVCNVAKEYRTRALWKERESRAILIFLPNTFAHTTINMSILRAHNPKYRNLAAIFKSFASDLKSEFSSKPRKCYNIPEFLL
jgi:hypothetical protein